MAYAFTIVEIYFIIVVVIIKCIGLGYLAIVVYLRHAIYKS